MTQQRPASRLVAILWTLAAVLAWVAVAIRYAREGTMNWSVAAAGLLGAAFAVGAWNRLRAPTSTGPGRAP